MLSTHIVTVAKPEQEVEMIHKKQHCLILLSVFLIVSLAACGNNEPNVMPGNAQAELPADALSAESTEAADPAGATLIPQPDDSKGYCLSVDGTVLMPGDPYPVSLFEETAEPVKTPDCRTNLMSTVYSYDGFTVQTAEREDLLTGEVTEPYITGIELRAPSSHALSGIRIGDSFERMTELYGEDCVEQYGGFVYERGQTVLSVYFNESGEVYFVSYAMNAALFQASSEESEAAAAEFIAALENSAEAASDEITFSGIHTRHEYSGKANYDPNDYDFASGVSARDAGGNELEVFYTEYVPQVTRNYGLGPVFCVFTAEDAAGNAAVAYQMAYCEVYDEAEAAEISQHYADMVDGTEEGILQLKNIIHRIPFSDTYCGFNPVSNFYNWQNGNCYGHNRLLAEVLECLGVEAYIMWDSTESHYWIIMRMEDGSWRHLDSTPLLEFPESVGFMTDAERAAIYPIRLWTTGIWPAAN